MNESKSYKVYLDGKEIEFFERFKGTVEIPMEIYENMASPENIARYERYMKKETSKV